jgi:hypothetical protein
LKKPGVDILVRINVLNQPKIVDLQRNLTDFTNRGEDVKESYYRHISNVANKNQAGTIMVLTQKDLEVFCGKRLLGFSKKVICKIDTTISSVRLPKSIRGGLATN